MASYPNELLISFTTQNHPVHSTAEMRRCEMQIDVISLGFAPKLHTKEK